jgi:hypothetical protein
MVDQVKDETPLGFRDPAFASCSWAIDQPFQAFCIEPRDAFAYGLRVTAQFDRNGRRPLTLPTGCYYLCPPIDVRWRMPASGQPVNAGLLALVLCRSRKQQFRHVPTLVLHLIQYFIYNIFKERSTSGVADPGIH